MQDGKILIAEDLTLSPQLTRTQFLASASGHTAQHVVNNSAYQAYSFTAQITDAVPCVFTLYFHEDTLRDAMVYPLWTAPAGEWLDSQFALEQENRFRNDALLVTLLGTPPYSYSWGEVLSIYDNRAGCSGILIRYAQSGRQ